MIEITVNGKRKQVRDGISLHELLQQEGLLSPIVTVAVNKRFLTKKDYGLILQQGDVIETVSFMDGG